MAFNYSKYIDVNASNSSYPSTDLNNPAWIDHIITVYVLGFLLVGGS